MQNIYSLAIVGILLFVAVLGCSRFSPADESPASTPNASNRTLADDAVDITTGKSTIGIPECDAVMDELIGQTKTNPDEGYIAKAFRQYWENTIRDAIRKSVEENKNDPEKLATECRKIKVQLDKFKAEEEAKKAEQ